jgi:pyrimidine-nucleoside phosphorylase
MSGRGLGITGGTVDKLASIPGFRLDLSPEELKNQAKEIGLALTGQTPDLAPADKVLYSLRDVTATVSSIPLIVSSILSKKLAGGAETVVLDVKCGSGAFMRTLEKANALASALSRTAKLCGLNIRIAITDMDQPLGSAVGNALEVAEAVRVLEGEDSRFGNLCVQLAGITLEASGLQPDRQAGELAARESIASGRALEKARQWFIAQGATVDVIQDPEALPKAPVAETIKYQGPMGWVSRIDATAIGQAVVSLGGGRQKKTDSIDASVGIELSVEVGSKVNPGDTLMTIHAASRESAAVAKSSVSESVEFAEEFISKREPILKLL